MILVKERYNQDPGLESDLENMTEMVAMSVNIQITLFNMTVNAGHGSNSQQHLCLVTCIMQIAPSAKKM